MVHATCELELSVGSDPRVFTYTFHAGASTGAVKIERSELLVGLTGTDRPLIGSFCLSALRGLPGLVGFADGDIDAR